MERLDADEQRFRALIEHSFDAIVLIGLDGVVRYASPSTRQILGYAPDEFIGANGFALVHPDDRPALLARFAALLNRPGETETVEVRIHHRDGGWRWIEAIGTNLLHQPSVEATVVNIRDISERKAFEQVLAARDEQLQAVLDGSSTVIQIKDRQGRYITVNRQWERLLGLSRTAVQSKTAADIFPEETAALLWRHDEQVLTSGTPLEFEEVVPHDDEPRIYLSMRFPLRDVDGQIYAVCGISTDITERKRIEAARLELAAIVQSSNDAVIGCDLAGAVTSWNAAAEHLYGYRADEIIGRPVSLLIPPGRSDEIAEILRQIARGDPVPQYETQRFTKTGRLVDVAITASPVHDADGRIVGASAIGRDITRRKRMDAQRGFRLAAGQVLASSFEYEETIERSARMALPVLADYCSIDLLDEEGRLQRIVTVHLDPIKEAVLREQIRRYPPQNNPAYPIRDVLRGGKSLLYTEITDAVLEATAMDAENLRLFRELAPTSCMVVPITAHERVLGALSFVSSRPDRRLGRDDLELGEEFARSIALAIDNARIYRAERQARLDAQQALALRDRFLSIASHELRTPLAGLKGYTQLARRRLARGTAPEALDSVLAQAEVQVDRLTQLIDELLDATRITEGRFTLRQESVDLGQLLRRVVELEQAVEPRRGIAILLPEGLAPLTGDVARLEQVLLNLLENARKYSPPKALVEVLVTDARDAVAIAVRDAGIGIPPEEQASIFERFQRAGNIDPSKVTGLGLGLYIAREIVAAHGGTLSVDSQLGKGSTFTVTLPKPP